MSSFALTIVTKQSFLWQLLVELGKKLSKRLSFLKTFRGECYCTEDPGSAGNVSVSDCGFNCFGDPTTLCGGEKNNIKLYSVYGTGR